jgi:hypothetical protein
MDPPKVVFPTDPPELLFPTDFAALDDATLVVGPAPRGPDPGRRCHPRGRDLGR